MEDNLLIYHIVGSNCYYKREFIEYIKNLDVNFYDLDVISNKINNKKLLKKCISIKNVTARAAAYRKIAYLWRNKMKKALDLILNQFSKNKKPIIIIGLNVYSRNRNINIDIPTTHKLFYNPVIQDYVKQTIKFNITEYMKDIMEGTFPLKYIDHTFVKKQREIIMDIYKQKTYKFISPNEIMNILQPFNKITALTNIDLHPQHGQYKLIKNEPNKILLTDTDEILYITSTARYENKISKMDTDIAEMLDHEMVYAYPEKWMALVTTNKILTKGDVELGINYIKQKFKQSLDKLKICGYIYIVDKNAFTQIGLRYKSNSDIQILRREYVSDIYEELQKCQIKII